MPDDFLLGTGVFVHGFKPPDWPWPPWPRYGGGRGGWDLSLPLYPVVLLAGLTLVGAWKAVPRRGTRVKTGLCETCRYDLTGIDGRCPECGLEIAPDPTRRLGSRSVGWSVQ